MTPSTVLRLVSSILLVWVVGCGDDPPPPIPGAGGPAGKQPPGVKRIVGGPGAIPGGPGQQAGAPGAPPAPTPGKTKKLEIELTEKDFKSGPNNRDPFRSYLGDFKPIVRKVTRDDRKVILRRFALDELELIAVVTGRAVRPRAMFRDPNGLGVTVKRGQRVSKNAAKIKRILRDKIIVEIEEQTEDKTTKVDRIIELHPKGQEATRVSDASEPEDILEQPPPKKQR